MLAPSAPTDLHRKTQTQSGGPHSGPPRGDPLYDQLLSFDGPAARRHGKPEGARIGSEIFAPVPRSASREPKRKAVIASVLGDERFKAELLAVIPHLRAFAYSRMKRAEADDLAQEAVLKAWKARASYQPGTNLKSWIFTILRNQYLSDMRRAWRTLPLDPGVAENTLVANDDPFAGEALLDVRNALHQLPPDQRHALVLVVVAGLSYEEAARLFGCAIGTIKSRVNRARETLAGILNKLASAPRPRTGVSSTQVFQEIMQGAADLQRRMEAALQTGAT